MYPVYYPYFVPYSVNQEFDSYRIHDEFDQRKYEGRVGQIVRAPADTEFWKVGTRVFIHRVFFDSRGREHLYVVYPIQNPSGQCRINGVQISQRKFDGVASYSAME
ncbi:hypothetical protein CHR37_05470 [Bacillus velezensis]|uniref:hypothetical protein n=1 Tax=Bacillus amyloliquefaciens group TaxID=1938374 RepID=UPI0002AA7193|nr:MULTISPECIES: hypothetical protein [Bacillus amyloliquefaciens group]AJE78743.1 hypothetical protein OY17_11760 [Bacillus sp. BH072]AMQ74201.1 hypothetical protein BAMY6614_12910 [Bacillus amyloliquefaciens UMAF6614]ATV22870.1 hypothetical protein CS547_09035 [Bacillus sp. Lzh-5]SLC52532.1 Uncharacterised protein [Mycobacteroides abscessus subsp. massiliense]AIU81883.1 hypothetical protein NG74_01798 [Bacillus velezensis]